MTRIAYLGPEGTFTEAALSGMVAAGLVPLTDFEPFPADSPSAAVQMVRDLEADYACVPIENSIEGSVLPTLDSLANGSLVQVFAEFTLDIAFTIAVRPGTTEPASIAAYPVARAQVARWAAKNLPEARFQAADSNAAAAVDVAEGRADAAVTTALAARRYGLEALAADVVDEQNARTRFVLAGLPKQPPPRTGADRTSVVLRLDNVPGALASALTEFSSATSTSPGSNRGPPERSWVRTSFLWIVSATSKMTRSPRHSRRLTNVVRTYAISVHGRRDRPVRRN